MGKKSRTKGKVGELEVISRLRGVWPDAARELDQFQESLTYDIKNTGDFKIQVKRRKTRPAVEAFLQEASINLSAFDIPVVMVRGDGGRWISVMYMDDWIDVMNEREV